MTGLRSTPPSGAPSPTAKPRPSNICPDEYRDTFLELQSIILGSGAPRAGLAFDLLRELAKALAELSSSELAVSIGATEAELVRVRRERERLVGVVVGLIVAIEERAEAGHNDTCQSVLETVEAYPCNCGHVAILASRSGAIQVIDGV